MQSKLIAICLFAVFVILILYYQSSGYGVGMREHMASDTSTNATEALQNVASMYNSGTLTATNSTITGTSTVNNLVVNGSIQMGANTLQTISDGSLVIYPTKLASGQPGTSANTLLQITPSGIIATPNGFITSNATPTAMSPDIPILSRAADNSNNKGWIKGFSHTQFGKYTLSPSADTAGPPIQIPQNNTIAIIGYGTSNMGQIVKGNTTISGLPKNPDTNADLDLSYNYPKYLTYLKSTGTDFDTLTGQKDSTGLFDAGRCVKTFM